MFALAGPIKRCVTIQSVFQNPVTNVHCSYVMAVLKFKYIFMRLVVAGSQLDVGGLF